MATRQTRGARPPAGYDASAFPSFAVTVDIAIFTLVNGDLNVLLVQRAGEPYAGRWALPGGFKRPDETLDDAAARELEEETAAVVPARLAQFRAYGDPGRDPRTNVVTIGYLAVLAEPPAVEAGSDAAEARLWAVADAFGDRNRLAFDHEQIVRDALEVARRDLELTDLAVSFLPAEFTLSELRAVYEAIWGVELEPANFRRSMLKAGHLRPAGRKEASGASGGRPAECFRATDVWAEGPPLRRPR